MASFVELTRITLSIYCEIAGYVEQLLYYKLIFGYFSFIITKSLTANLMRKTPSPDSAPVREATVDDKQSNTMNPNQPVIAVTIDKRIRKKIIHEINETNNILNNCITTKH